MEKLFGQYIKELRTEKGITLTRLAAMLDMDSANLSKVENGKRDFDIKRLPFLCDFFNLDLNITKKELVSEKIAKEVKEADLDSSVLELANHKTKYLINDSFSMTEEQQILFEEITWKEKLFSRPNAEIRLGTLFSGIGAIEQALKRLNLKNSITFAGDIDPHVKQSYFANYEISTSNWHSDITTFSAEKYYGEVDLLVGGSPCQAFSMVGKRLGLEDVRGTLFYDFARIVNETKPKVFIYENVKGLKNHDNGNTWTVVKDVLSGLGYKLFDTVMNSKDYGIPQNRERIIVVGFADDTVEFEFPKKVQLEYTMQDFLEDYTDSKYYLKEKGIKFVTSSKNRQKRYTQINGEVALCQKANQQFNWHGDFVFERTLLQREKRSKKRRAVSDFFIVTS